MHLQSKEVSQSNFIFDNSEIIFCDHRLEFVRQLASSNQLVIAPFLLGRWKLLHHGIQKRGRRDSLCIGGDIFWGDYYS